MKDEEYQGELFKEFDGGDKRRSKVPHSLLARPTSIVVPLERVVFIAIGVLMALVIAHAIGIERGKVLARHEGDKRVIKKNKEAVVNSGQYTVLIATYKQKSLAETEMARLNKYGYSAFLIGRGDYLNLCVGRFSTLEEAYVLQGRLRDKYKTCFVSRITKGK